MHHEHSTEVQLRLFSTIFQM